jgi:uncharacterized lipoprotein YddW (UPF0748 family)
MLPLVALALLAGPAPAPAEVRGLWVVRTGLVSPAMVDRTVEQARAAGFNTLFVQVRGRGDAFYRSRLVPRGLILSTATPDFDPLARLLDRAHAEGMQVHAWVNVLLAAHFTQPLPAGHLLRDHPEWVMVPRRLARPALSSRREALLDLVRDGERGRADVEGLYLTPSAPGLAEALEDMLGELLRAYDVDGLHLDFIRYPNGEYDYSRAALEGFHGGAARPEDLLDGPRRDPEGWDAYRRRVLTGLVDRLSRRSRVLRPGLPVSAAVVADGADAERNKFQSWAAWARGRLLDALCPMAYTPDPAVFRRQLAQAVTEAGGTPVWVGIGAYRLELSGIVENVWAARRQGAAGVVLFSHESLAPVVLPRFRALVFDPPVAFRDSIEVTARAADASGTERQ